MPSKDEIVTSMPEPEAPDVQVTAFLGIHALAGKNAALGTRVGFRFPKKKELYLGPEILVAPLGESSVVYTLLTAEQSLSLAGDGRISAGGVVWAGVAFPQGIAGVGSNAMAVGVEVYVMRRIDELARLRLAVRTGLVAGNVMGLGSFGVAFRL